jgi:hypothetical protein
MISKPNFYKGLVMTWKGTGNMKAIVMDRPRIRLNEPDLSQDLPANLAAKIRTIIPGYDQLPADEIRDDVLLFPEKSVLTPSRRLVVLVPRGGIAENALARRIWRLASASNLGVLYLTLSQDEEQVSYYRRRLTDLAMSTSDYKIRAYTNVSSGENWIDFVRRTLQPGDLVVCMTNHRFIHNFFQRRRLGEELFNIGKAPVYMLSGFRIGPAPEWEFFFKEVLAWVTSLLLIVAFLGLDVGIDHSTGGMLSKILIGLSIVGEFVLLLKVSEWINRP